MIDTTTITNALPGLTVTEVRAWAITNPDRPDIDPITITAHPAGLATHTPLAGGPAHVVLTATVHHFQH